MAAEWLYVGGDALYVLDARNPIDLKLLKSYKRDNNNNNNNDDDSSNTSNSVYGVDVLWPVAYVAMGNGEGALSLLNVEKDEITLMGNVKAENGHFFRGVAVWEGGSTRTAFIADSGNNSDEKSEGSALVVDVSEPSKPKVLGSGVEVLRRGRNVTEGREVQVVAGKTAYLATAQGLEVVDVRMQAESESE